MADVTWHDRVEECPNGVAVLLKYDDGSIDLEAAEDNDLDWAKFYPQKPPADGSYSVVVAWAAVE